MSLDTTLTYKISLPKNSHTKAPLLLLLHGYGSNENDLLALRQQIPDSWLVVSVRGTYTMAENSYKWYTVNQVNGHIAIAIEEEEVSRKKLLALISDIRNKYAIDSNRIVVAGFSQGANMAQCIGLSEPGWVAGFGVFSGRYVDEFTPYINRTVPFHTTKAFLSHGSTDTMLPIAFATENKHKLQELGISLTYCEDITGHAISAKQWQAFSQWLNTF